MDLQTQAKWDKAAPTFDIMAGDTFYAVVE